MQRFLGIIVGILFLVVGVFMYFKNNNLIKNCTVEAIATVVDMKQELDTDSNDTTYLYYPIIEYKAGENTVRVTMDSGSSTPRYNINDKITVLYNPNNTKEFIVKGEKGSNIFSIVFMVLGAIVTVFGIKVAIKKN